MLHEIGATMGTVVDARKAPLDGDATWALLAGLGEIVVVQGSKVVSFDPRLLGKEETLARVLGRSGTLRAPALRRGDRLLVGYGEALYAMYVR